MLLLNRARLEEARGSFALGEEQKLRELAAEALENPVRTVMDKSVVPPSGDKHDYLSFGPYWWPDPDTADGLPYVRRDGQINPENEKTDFVTFRAQMRDVQTLSIAFFYTRESEFAAAAARRLRAWFLDEETRMNPHLEFGQAIPGRCDGRGIGIIDTARLCLLPDLLELLRESDDWSAADDERLKEWLSRYLDWLLASAHGQDEARQHNNHGTWYDAQVASFALATGRRAEAFDVLEAAPARRLAAQVASDGSQPHELERTLSFNYSCFNLLALFDLATLSAHVGLDMWNWKDPHDAGESPLLQRAIRFLEPYAEPQRPWPFPQLTPRDPVPLLALLQRASQAYPADEWNVPGTRTQRDALSSSVLFLWP